MRKAIITSILLVLLACIPCFAQRTATPAAAGDNLFLSATDIPRVHQLAPGLAAATAKGSKETQTFLATQEMSFAQLEQTLSNISVAYTALKFEEYLKELQPALDQNQNSQYRQLLSQSQKQLDQITAKYQAATKNGRSALDTNKAFVSQNINMVEELLVHVKGFKVDSLPRQ